MTRLALAIHVPDAFPDDNVFEMGRGTEAARAAQYFEMCRAPRGGSVELVELDVSGKVRRILRSKAGPPPFTTARSA